MFTGFNFELVDTSYTSNPSWVNIVADSELEFDMKNTLRQGSYKDLNLYFVTGPVLEGEEVLGYAYVKFFIIFLPPKTNNDMEH